jgi:hypothetical protein
MAKVTGNNGKENYLIELQTPTGNSIVAARFWVKMWCFIIEITIPSNLTLSQLIGQGKTLVCTLY